MGGEGGRDGAHERRAEGRLTVHDPFTTPPQTGAMTTTETLTIRDIELEVAFNVRHLGGYATAAGSQTRATAVRAATLHRLTEAGIERLRERDVRVVVDLRSTVERERDTTPDLAWAGITPVHAPVFEQDASPVGFEGEFAGFATIYERFLETGKPAYRTLFALVARTDGAVLFHCSAGKDRTGVAAALLLDLAGVGHDEIVADYARSEALLAPLVEIWRTQAAERATAAPAQPPVDPERGRKLLASNAEDMEATLALIGERWGGAHGYLEALGLTPAEIDAIRSRMVA